MKKMNEFLYTFAYQHLFIPTLSSLSISSFTPTQQTNLAPCFRLTLIATSPPSFASESAAPLPSKKTSPKPFPSTPPTKSVSINYWVVILFLLVWSTIPPFPPCDPTTSLCERHCCPAPFPSDEETVTGMIVVSGPEAQTRKYTSR